MATPDGTEPGWIHGGRTTSNARSGTLRWTSPSTLDPDDLALIENATSGVNGVLRSLRFAPGDELLVPDHAYKACRNVLDYVASRSNARVVTVEIPFPIEGPEVVIERVLDAVTDRTALAMLDTVTSPTGLRMPFEPLIEELERRGIRLPRLMRLTASGCSISTSMILVPRIPSPMPTNGSAHRRGVRSSTFAPIMRRISPPSSSAMVGRFLLGIRPDSVMSSIGWEHVTPRPGAPSPSPSSSSASSILEVGRASCPTIINWHSELDESSQNGWVSKSPARIR